MISSHRHRTTKGATKRTCSRSSSVSQTVFGITFTSASFGIIPPPAGMSRTPSMLFDTSSDGCVVVVSPSPSPSSLATVEATVLAAASTNASVLFSPAPVVCRTSFQDGPFRLRRFCSSRGSYSDRVFRPSRGPLDWGGYGGIWGEGGGATLPVSSFGKGGDEAKSEIVS